MEIANQKEWMIYKHTNKINGKIYIGQTCQKFSERCGIDGWRYEKSAPIFWKAIKKYGWENFDHEIIEEHITTIEKANEREQYWIKYYDCCVLDGKDKGYNADRGGGSFSSEMRSIIAKENWKNEEYRKIFCKPVICVNTQKIYPSLVEAAKEYNIDESGISSACRKVHNSAGQDSEGNPLQWEFYEEGKKYIYENPKYKNKRLTSVICTTTGQIFHSVTEAAAFYHLNGTSGISSCLSGKQKTAGKLEDGTRLCWQIYIEGKEYKKETNTGKGNKKVICLETGEIFQSIKDAANSINGNVSNLSAHLHGRQLSCGKDLNGEPLHWKFYEE